jgi:sugar phosphate permease
MGTAMMAAFNGTVVALQEYAAADERGMTMGLFSSVYLGGQAAAGVIAGALAGRFGLTAAVMTGAVSATVIGLLLLLVNPTDSAAHRGDSDASHHHGTYRR